MVMINKIKKLRYGLRKTVITALLMFGIIPMISVGLLYFLFHLQNQKEIIYSTQMRRASTLSYEITSYILKNKESIEFYGSIMTHGIGYKNFLRDMSWDLIYQNKEYDIVEVFNQSGNRLFKISRSYRKDLIHHEHGSYNEKIKSVLKGMTFVSDVEFLSKNKPYIYIMASMSDVWNVIKGAIVVHMNLNLLLRKISTMNQADNSLSYLITRDGKLISFGNLSPSMEDKRRNESIIKFIKGMKGVSIYRGLNGSWVIGAVSPCRISGIGVVVETPLFNAFRNIYIFVVIFLLLISITVIFSILFGIRFSIKNLIGPIQELKEKAGRIAEGNFDIKIGLKRDDELGELAEKFDSMARDLKDKTVLRELLLKEIEERKAIEESLRISEEKYRKIFENTGTPTILIDNNMMILMANTEFERLSGYSKHKLEGKVTIHKFLNDEALSPIRSFISDRTKTSLRYELNFLSKDGEVKDIYAHIMVLEHDKTYIVSITDMTPIRRAEKLFTDMVKNIEIGLFMLQDGKFVLVNPQFEKSTGYTTEELIGMESILLVHPDDRDIVKRHAIEMLKGKRSIPYEYRAIRKNGEIRWIMESLKSIIYEGKRTVFGNYIDITEKKKMEEELLRIQQLESLGTLAGGIAHDFNNILTSILGNISFAKMELKQDTKLYKLLDKAESASFRAKELTNRFLAFSEGGYGIRKTESFKNIIRDSMDIALSGSHVRCEVSIPEDLWNVNVDVDQMKQVMNNLLINAKESMEDRAGTIWIEAKNEYIKDDSPYPLKPGKYVKISVRDEGEGISEVIMDRIFEPYFTTKQRGARKGMGLGLTLVHSIIKKHGGYIYVESEKGKGSTFSFFIPASEAEPKHEQMGREPKEKGYKTKEKKRVLLMDDEPMIRSVAKEMLLHMGYDVELAKNGEEVIEVFQKAREQNMDFDIMILDLTVKGGMGGKETIREIKRIDPSALAIVTSGYSNDPVLNNYKEFGFSGAIKKPFTISSLKAEIERVFKECI